MYPNRLNIRFARVGGAVSSECVSQLCAANLRTKKQVRAFDLKHHPDKNTKATDKEKKDYAITRGCWKDWEDTHGTKTEILNSDCEKANERKNRSKSRSRSRSPPASASASAAAESFPLPQARDDTWRYARSMGISEAAFRRIFYTDLDQIVKKTIPSKLQSCQSHFDLSTGPQHHAVSLEVWRATRDLVNEITARVRAAGGNYNTDEGLTRAIINFLTKFGDARLFRFRDRAPSCVVAMLDYSFIRDFALMTRRDIDPLFDAQYLADLQAQNVASAKKMAKDAKEREEKWKAQHEAWKATQEKIPAAASAAASASPKKRRSKSPPRRRSRSPPPASKAKSRSRSSSSSSSDEEEAPESLNTRWMQRFNQKRARAPWTINWSKTRQLYYFHNSKTNEQVWYHDRLKHHVLATF